MLTTSRWRTGWSAARLGAALLIAAAVLAQALRTIGGALTAGTDVSTTATNFFSFFTVLSNTASVVVLAWAGTRGLSGRRTQSPASSLALACVTTYMLVTGVVYNLLLRHVALPQGTTVAWSNEVLHLVGPLFLLADCLVGPVTFRLPWRAVAVVLVFPVVWIAYTLVRGPLVTSPATGAPWWYPYPFLDPHQMGGYLGILPYVIGIAATLGGFAALVVLVGRRRALQPV